MKRYWLLFAQTVTVGLAVWFIVTTLQPDWARHIVGGAQSLAGIQPGGNPSLTVREAPIVPVGQAQGSYRQAAGRAMPSVVNIFTAKSARRQSPMMDDPLFRRFFGERPQEEKQESLGSGVIVSANGYILTNNHVVEAADQIEVALADGRTVTAKLVGTDPETDLAVIKIELNNLPAIMFGNAEQAKVGDVVLAIGNPFGVGETITMGIISALGRNNLRINAIENFIQTDAAINPGNSGGALVDTNGNLLGINTAIFSRSGGSLGIGFAIPVSTAKQVMESIIRTGHVVRGSIGVEIQEFSPELADTLGVKFAKGVLISGVERGGPAATAGLRPSDVVTAVAGKSVSDTTALRDMIVQLAPGTKTTLTVLRKNAEMNVAVTVGRRRAIARTPDAGSADE
jgi:serine protease DegQ